ncbi:L-lactate MFS transporter [Enterococcus bulliens]
MKHQRYIVATAGILLHLMIGSVYAFSVFSVPIAMKTNWSESSISFTFSLAIFFLGMSAAFMGRLVERFGPTATGTLSGICYGLGTILTGVAIYANELWLLYLGYGIIGGLGLGAGYVTPVSTIIKWFPDKRGLATGLAIMGFGFAALLTGPIAQQLMESIGLVNTFYVLGVVYGIVIIAAAQFIKQPQTKAVDQKNASHEMTANQAVRTPAFIYLWLMLFINISCGIGLVSAASPMAQEMTAMSPTVAAFMVGILGLFNGFGRLIWATLSDYIGRPMTFTVMFIVNIAMFFSILTLGNMYLFVLAFCLLLSCYGAGFSVIPAYLGDVFGTRELGAIHGYILTAWAMAGLAGPILLSYMHEKTGSYLSSLAILIGLNLIAVTLSIVIRRYLPETTKTVSKKMISTNDL